MARRTKASRLPRQPEPRLAPRAIAGYRGHLVVGDVDIIRGGNIDKGAFDRAQSVMRILIYRNNERIAEAGATARDIERFRVSRRLTQRKHMAKG